MYYAVYQIFTDAFIMTIKAFFAILTKPIYASQLNMILFVAEFATAVYNTSQKTKFSRHKNGSTGSVNGRFQWH